MENRIKILPWVLLGIVSAALIIILANQDASTADALTWLKNPVLVGIIVATFAYLTIGRLKNMDERIAKVEERSVSFWQSAIKEVQEVSSGHAKNTINNLKVDLESEVHSYYGKIENLVSENPWLKNIHPEDISHGIKHLEPIHSKISAVLKSEPEKSEWVRVWLSNLIEDQGVVGAPNDYHNLGVVAARDLDDKLLAMKIYMKYLDGREDPNADVLSDALQIATQTEDWNTGEELAVELREKLYGEDFRFTNRWRPWVFLADYLIAKGLNSEAIVLLERAKIAIKSPGERAHAIRNLASSYVDLDEKEKASDTYDELMNEYPDHIPGVLSYVRFLMSENEMNKALEICEASVERGNINPEFDPHFEMLTQYKERLQGNDSDNPEDHFKRGIQLVLAVASEELDEEAFLSLTNSVKDSLSL